MLPQGHPLVLKSKAAWGKPVEEEAKLWQETKLPFSCFGSADPTSDEDFCNGCYEMSFPSLHRTSDLNRFWIRSDYVKFSNYLDMRWDTIRSRDSTLETSCWYSIVLTGQPGIGKSSSIPYILCRRLGQTQPMRTYPLPTIVGS
ncbi:hypothetical protein QCA50_013531 [Cerrena zonata]|uniref:Uncharacterized protein n=1 Tax=Cerrena zonata TaxID=2478898 RepID=A0AAW0FW13_9APHY